jgi:hypothetical protein
MKLCALNDLGSFILFAAVMWCGKDDKSMQSYNRNTERERQFGENA